MVIPSLPLRPKSIGIVKTEALQSMQYRTYCGWKSLKFMVTFSAVSASALSWKDFRYSYILTLWLFFAVRKWDNFFSHKPSIFELNITESLTLRSWRGFDSIFINLGEQINSLWRTTNAEKWDKEIFEKLQHLLECWQPCQQGEEDTNTGSALWLCKWHLPAKGQRKPETSLLFRLVHVGNKMKKSQNVRNCRDLHRDKHKPWQKRLWRCEPLPYSSSQEFWAGDLFSMAWCLPFISVSLED